MIAIDTNLLVYSHREEMPHHVQSLELLKTLRQSGNWAIPWPCVHEFLAIVTSSKIFKIPTPCSVAFAAIESWLAAGNLTLIGESFGHLTTLKIVSVAAKSSGGRFHDAKIAAICIDHGVGELWTADRDFSFFPQLRTRNPLVSKT